MTRVIPPTSHVWFAIERTEITPPVGTYHRMWGAAAHEVSDGVHRPLYVTTMLMADSSIAKDEVLASADSLQLIVALDHCILGPEEVADLRNAISRDSGIPATAILVHFSHTHAAGLLGYDRSDQPGGAGIRDYWASVAAKAGKLASWCVTNLNRASLRFGIGRCDLAAQRDFWDEESQQFVCGYNPHAEADDTVLVASVHSLENGELVATLVNYACHPTTLAWANTKISPDYPGAMREVVESAYGGLCCFFQGASGDLGPVEGYVGDTEVADRNGRQLGHAALSTLIAMPAPAQEFAYTGPVISGATLGSWGYRAMGDDAAKAKSAWRMKRLTIELPYRASMQTAAETEADLNSFLTEEAKARESGDEQAAADWRAKAERKRRNLKRLADLPPGEMYPYEAVVWKAGDVAFVFIQGEPYQQLQTQIRAANPSVTILVAGISNSWGPSYLPPRDLYDRGLYQESIAILEAGALETIIEVLSKTIAELG